MIFYITGFFFIWLSALTFILVKTKNHYQNLVSSTSKRRLEDILNELLEKNKKSVKEIEVINNHMKANDQTARLFFQKIGFVRYDPFESRGEQSFVIALLNREDSGIVINFIYTRDGLRTYAKKVIHGKGEKYDLSEEEIKAIEKSSSTS